MDNVKKTPLYGAHVRHGGKVVEYAGWALPVQYEGLMTEHEAVRNAAGLFDVSHMGEITVKGKDAFKFIQKIFTNDISKLMVNQVIYGMMCYPDGGVVDDLLVYKHSNDNFYLVVNAGNIEKDYEWMIENKKELEVEIENISDNVAELALQGPNAQKILKKLTDYDLSSIKFFFFKDKVKISGVECLVSRTGYTGEDGFEIYTKPEVIEAIFEDILKAGEEEGLKLAGLGARDTLRFEATLPLYGHEISKDITPLEAGLGFFVKLDKDDFIGKKVLVEQKEKGLLRKIIGFELEERGVARQGCDVVANGENIGFVTTGYFSPTLKKYIGLAMADIKYAKIGNEIEIMIRNKPKKAKIISKRFYQKKYKK